MLPLLRKRIKKQNKFHPQLNLLRILHLNTEKGFRGGEQQVVNLIHGLGSVQTVGQACLVRSGEQLEQQLHEHSVRLFPWKRSSADVLFPSKHLINAVKEFQPNIIHAHSGNAHTLGYQLLKSLQTKGQQHPSAPKFLVTRRVDFPPKKSFFSGQKYTNSFTHYVAISTAIREILLNSGVSKENVVVIPSGVDPNRFQFSEEARSRWRLEWKATSNETLVVGMVGAYVDHKDPLNLVRATAHLKAACESLTNPRALRVVLIGEGELRPQIEEERERLGLQQNLILTGWQTTVGELLSALDLFVMPSKLEGLCTSLIDAQAFGLPCVATQAGGIPDVITHNENGLLVPPQQPQSLSTAILQLAEDKSMQSLFTENGKRRVQQRFTLQAMTKQYQQLYKNLLNESNA